MPTIMPMAKHLTDAVVELHWPYACVTRFMHPDCQIKVAQAMLAAGGNITVEVRRMNRFSLRMCKTRNVHVAAVAVNGRHAPIHACMHACMHAPYLPSL